MSTLRRRAKTLRTVAPYWPAFIFTFFFGIFLHAHASISEVLARGESRRRLAAEVIRFEANKQKGIFPENR